MCNNGIRLRGRCKCKTFSVPSDRNLKSGTNMVRIKNIYSAKCSERKLISEEGASPPLGDTGRLPIGSSGGCGLGGWVGLQSHSGLDGLVPIGDQAI